MRRWDPLQDLLSLQERMNRLFEESLQRLDEPLLPSGSWTPPTDVLETREGFVVQVELPGMGPADVEVRVDGSELTVRGERRPSGRQRPESFHRMERSYGQFSRSFRLTAEVDGERLKMHFEDGLLHVDLPKLPRPRSGSERKRRGRG